MALPPPFSCSPVFRVTAGTLLKQLQNYYFCNKASNHLENQVSILHAGASIAFDKFLILLKTRGPQPTAVVASELGISNEGARFQLTKLSEDGLVSCRSVSKGVGRPTLIWELTDKGLTRFPNTHAELTVQLIDNVIDTLGEEALQAIIENREKKVAARYQQALTGAVTMEEKLTRLAAIRNQEGYMSEWAATENGFVFIENHCPICAAAKQCKNFCQAEFATFQQLLGNEVHINRTEHIVNGARRCVYEISELVHAV